ncbi:MAG: hypothetical protein ACLQFR_13830 [Streptosporangiaceae bacterium]
MFVREVARLPLGIDAARTRLANLIGGGTLIAAAQQTYTDGITGKLRVGPLGSAPVLSRLVEVSFRDLVSRGDQTVLTLRWKAAGAGGGLFPVLDADITLTPAGAGTTRSEPRRSEASGSDVNGSEAVLAPDAVAPTVAAPTVAAPEWTELRLDGVYRPPFGAAGAGLDRAILHRVATATIRAFVTQLADAIASPAAAVAAGYRDQA